MMRFLEFCISENWRFPPSPDCPFSSQTILQPEHRGSSLTPGTVGEPRHPGRRSLLETSVALDAMGGLKRGQRHTWKHIKPYTGKLEKERIVHNFCFHIPIESYSIIVI